MAKFSPGLRRNNAQAEKSSDDTGPKFPGLIIHVIRVFFSAEGVRQNTKQLCETLHFSRDLISYLDFCHYLVPILA